MMMTLGRGWVESELCRFCPPGGSHASLSTTVVDRNQSILEAAFVSQLIDSVNPQFRFSPYFSEEKGEWMFYWTRNWVNTFENLTEADLSAEEQ